MSASYSSLTVALEQDVSEEYVEALKQAIAMMRGVLKVEANVSDHTQWTADERARHEFGQKLIGIVYQKRESR